MISFLTIGRVLYDKGYAELIAVAEQTPEAEFRWLGPIDESYPLHVTERNVRADVARGVIRYLGFTSDVRPHIADADCVVLPSYHEGLSRTLMEALAMGKPIITTDIPGCRETVKDGINGFICEPRNANSLRSAIIKFISLREDDRSAMGIASRILAEQRFDIRTVITRYESIIQNNC